MKRLFLLFFLLLVAAAWLASPAEASCPGCSLLANIGYCISVGGAIQSINPNGTVTCFVPAIPKQTCMMVIGADNGPVLANADIGPQGSQCFIAAASTIIEVTVKADAGTPSALPRLEDIDGITNTNLLSGALSTAAFGHPACANVGGTTGIDGFTTCSATLTVTALPKGDWLGLASGVAGGTAKRVSVAVTYTTP